MKHKILAWVKKWESRGYSNGIPDEAHIHLEAAGRVPSYRMICLAIMKNDVTLESLGYTRPHCPAYMEIKRIELTVRGKIKPSPQLRLFP